MAISAHTVFPEPVGALTNTLVVGVVDSLEHLRLDEVEWGEGLVNLKQI